VWPLLKHSPDPRVRSYLIHYLSPRLPPQGGDSGAVARRLDEEKDVSIRRALLLVLGEFSPEQLPAEERDQLASKVLRLFRADPDAGLHGTADWLLRQWGKGDDLKEIDRAWAADPLNREERMELIRGRLGLPKRQGRVEGYWYVNGQGQTMVVIPGPMEFLMGSPTTEVGRRDDETQHKKRIGRTFALAAKSVTVEQYRKFDDGQQVPAVHTRTADLPVAGTSWHQAAGYCNWLSKEEGIAEDQWCYEIEDGQVTKLKANYLSRTGYRLPTESEMEVATRAGALTSRYFGETEDLLPKYARYVKNSQEHTWPVGSLKPNDLGLFDVQGNVWTWCQESYKAYPASKDDGVYEDKEDVLSIDTSNGRVLRGGSFDFQASNVRSAFRVYIVPAYRNADTGFRPARTFR
jgi:formylglycine-generating enzyme required for sulfatase activity